MEPGLHGDHSSGPAAVGAERPGHADVPKRAGRDLPVCRKVLRAESQGGAGALGRGRDPRDAVKATRRAAAAEDLRGPVAGRAGGPLCPEVGAAAGLGGHGHLPGAPLRSQHVPWRIPRRQRVRGNRHEHLLLEHGQAIYAGHAGSGGQPAGQEPGHGGGAAVQGGV